MEDDAQCREEVCEYLRRREFDVVVFENGRDLVEHANLRDFDLALFDIDVPYIDGLEVLDYINRLEIDLPVVISTGDTSEKAVTKAFARGCEDFITKPFFLKELELRIVKAIRKRMKNVEVQLDKECYFDNIYRKLYRNGKSLKMTSIQQKILYLLVKELGEVVEYEKFYDYIWEGKEVSQNALASHIRDIRKLLPDGLISSVSKTGYRLVARPLHEDKRALHAQQL